MWIKNRRARDLIGGWLESIANEVCEQHCAGLTQEHQLSARIGQALERQWGDELRGADILNHKVMIVTQDIPDKGHGAMERSLGADLYVGVEIFSDQGRVSKGFLVQAKWDGSLPKREREALDRQRRSMLERSSESYVWTYSEVGIRSRHAEGFGAAKSAKSSMPDGIGRLISEVLACNKGDPRLGLPDVGDIIEKRKALAGMLRELSVPHGVALSVAVPPNSDG